MGDQKQFVVALGGSAVYPDGIDVKFLNKFCNFIKEKSAENYKFVIVVGGKRQGFGKCGENSGGGGNFKATIIE